MNDSKEKFIPLWLFRLPAGEYSLTYLAKHTRKHKQSLTRTLKNLGLKVEYRQTENCKFLEAIYFWDGKLDKTSFP